ncbi:hypothetical protein OPV22_030362 [Ensete ventricosum]|uniref:(S)-ureidoglycine aminohydrolase cupin domain-containing protein n=1 Tax=Ensete ventricosum TaxID=4639 RepID=A0AAV8QFR6_ENSVE|nr:hypothetical protein OPV22_030362 [Ensete ventricosum]RWW23874.1 hypothetical protein GW17_00011853 [Ensete ventricosum]RZS16992.1 hypothetical protein BHM03_00049079 [Ensete ventricosum]
MASSSNPGAKKTDAPYMCITVEKNIPQRRLEELGINSWLKWGCPPGRYPIKFEAEETCYLVKGKVEVYFMGSSGSECMEISGGDFVTFPKGLSCIWVVSAPVDKYYKFTSPS